VERQQVQPGSVTCIQRFGSALSLNVHYHLISLKGVYLDRTHQGRKPRFLKVEVPTDTDIADVCSCGAGDVVQKISRWVIRTLRHLGYLETGLDTVVTDSDPCVTTSPSSPALWRPPSCSISPLGSGPDKTCAALAQALGMQGNTPH
jgi:Putative transposase